MTAFEKLIAPDTDYCFSGTPGLADLCLVPQLYNARRWGCELSALSRLSETEARCLDLSAFDAARPENQTDAN